MIESFKSTWAEKEFRQYTYAQLIIAALYFVYCMLAQRPSVWSLLVEFGISAVNFAILIIRLTRKEYPNGKA